jgi:hypothetical protein
LTFKLKALRSFGGGGDGGGGGTDGGDKALVLGYYFGPKTLPQR